MKVAVTGAAGQLGTVLLRRLVRDRSIKQVVALDLRPPAVPGGKIAWVQADVREPDIGRHFAGCEAVVHLAFVVTQLRPRAEVEAINVGGTKNVFTAAQRAGVGRVLYTSSIAAYGVTSGHPQPLVEDSPRKYVPAFPYSATKYLVEEFLDGFEAEHPELSVCRLRPGILIGAHLPHPMGRLLHQRILPDLFNLPQPLVWDEDVAEALVQALKLKARGAFNLCADEALLPRDLARATGMRYLHVPLPLALLGVRLSPLLSRLGLGEPTDAAWIHAARVSMLASSDKAQQLLGWRPRYPTALAVMRRFVEVAPGRLDPRIALFLRTADFAARRSPPMPELSGFTSRIHLSLLGPRGGDCGIDVKDGRLRIEKLPPRPPTATVTMTADLLLDLLAGRADFGSAHLTGRIRVDGEGHAAMLIGGMVAMFRAAGKSPGAAGIIGRALQRFFSQGRPPQPQDR